MQVILRENYPGLGFIGDTVAVKRGFARNFLIPRGVALEAGNKKNKKELEHHLNAINSKKRKMQGEAEVVAQKIADLKLKFTLKMGRKGKAFGSISASDIEKAINEKGIELDRRQVKLLEPIKAPGEYVIDAKLHPEVTARISIDVQGMITEKKASAQEDTTAKKQSKEHSSEEQGDDIDEFSDGESNSSSTDDSETGDSETDSTTDSVEE